MPGLLHTLRDSANRITYEGVQLHLVPRGLVYPLDFGGLGQIRFGQKEGSQLPIIRPDNRFLLEEAAPVGSDFLILEINPTWMEPGGYVRIGNNEIHAIDDVNENTIFLTARLLSDYDAGQFVYHYSNPIDVEGNYSAGQLVINVDSPRFLVRGDVIALPRSLEEITTTFVEYQIVDLQQTSYGSGIYQYQITLDRVLQQNLVDGQVLQLRAYPAYKSNIRNVPSDAGSLRRISGPFLIDWVSAPLRNKMEVGETQTVYYYNNSRLLLTKPRVVEKNTTVLRNPILPDQFLFWQKVNGEISYDNRYKKFVMIPNKDGHWRLKYECVPLIEVPVDNAIGTIQCVDPSQLNNNQNFVLDDTDTITIFEFKVNAGYVPTPSAAATGSIQVGSIPSDNQWISIDDGYGGIIDLEFRRTSSFSATSGKYSVDVRSAVIPTDVAIILREFLEKIVNFQITPTTLGDTVLLTHKKVSTKGNQPIAFDAGLVGWIFAGMSGGTDEVVTMDVGGLTTDLEVAQVVSGAISGKELLISASYPSLVPLVELESSVPGATANIPITTTVTATDWNVYGMDGGGGGFRWTVTLKPEVDALFRIRFFPNDWQTFNLTGGIDQTINIEILATDEPIEMIDMLLRADSGSECLMGQWNLTGARVGAISYDYVARVLGDYNFASSTLLLKPLFQSLNEVEAVLDSGLAHDSGFMRL